MTSLFLHPVIASPLLVFVRNGRVGVWMDWLEVEEASMVAALYVCVCRAHPIARLPRTTSKPYPGGSQSTDA
jgi:hypothetical protein